MLEILIGMVKDRRYPNRPHDSHSNATEKAEPKSKP